MQITETAKAQKKYFATGATLTYSYRKAQLKKLREVIVKNEDAINRALHEDLKKSKEEVWITEIAFVLNEIDYMLQNLRKLMKPDRKGTNLANLPSGSYVYAEPLGTVLIIGPWNYPLQLCLVPLAGAMAAGNTVMLKPSEFAPATAALMKKMIAENFDANYLALVEGDGATVVPALMNNFSFDHVFYTGSTAVGKKIYEMAAARLAPVTLELGGKSPCVVEADANIEVAARRICLPKFSNAGQMCVAPDHVLVHNSIKQELTDALQKTIQEFLGKDAQSSRDYGRIVNTKQFDRLVAYLDEGRILYGGKTNRDDLYIEPTLLTDIKPGAKIMEEEIFGPLLPMIGFDTMEEALEIINKNKNPLAFYVFTGSDKKAEAWLQAVPSGGACVNNASVHLTNHHLPFGGRGFSGTGQYHGEYSFKTFSHRKAVLKTPTWIDPSIKYPPYAGKLNMLKKLV